MIGAQRREDAKTAAFLFGGTLALFGLACAAYLHGGESYEFCHYGEIARNILRGVGFKSGTYWPCELAYLARAGGSVGKAGPVVGRFPLFAFWTALWMVVGGFGDLGVALGNGVAHALWVALVYLAGRDLFNRRAALAAAVLWAVSPAMLGGFDLYGHPDVLFGLLFGLLNVLWWRAWRGGAEPEPGACLGLGLLAGLAYLDRESLGIWLPFYLLGPSLLRRRLVWRGPAAFLAGFLALAVPWSLYYFSQVGLVSPPILLWNLADHTLVGALPWMEYRTYRLSDFLAPGIPATLARKWFVLFNQLLRDLPGFWMQHVFFPFGVAGAATVGGEAGGFGLWLAALFGWEALVLSVIRYESLGQGFMSGRYYLWLAPWVILYAAAFFERRLASRGWRWAAAVALALQLQCWAGGFAAIVTRSDYPGGVPIPDWPEFSYIRSKTPPEAWIVTNIPTQIAWYAGRRTMNITNRPGDMAAMLERWPADYLFLSSSRVGEPRNYPAWQAALGGQDGRPPAEVLRGLGFEPERAFPGGVLFRRASEPGASSRP